MSQTRIQQLKNMAQSLIASQAWPQLVRIFDEIVELEPTDPSAHYNRASVLFQLNRIEDAHDALTRALELQPNYRLAQTLLDKVTQKRLQQAALEIAVPTPPTETTPSAIPTWNLTPAEENVPPAVAPPIALTPTWNLTPASAEPSPPPSAEPVVEWNLQPTEHVASAAPEPTGAWNLTPTEPVTPAPAPPMPTEWTLTPAASSESSPIVIQPTHYTPAEAPPTSPMTVEGARDPVQPAQVALGAEEGTLHWCTVGNMLDPGTVLEAHLHDPGTSGVVQLTTAQGRVKVDLRPAPSELLRTLRANHLKSLGLQMLSIGMSIVAFIFSLLMLLLSFLAILTGNVFSVFSAMYRTGRIGLNLLLDIVRWFKGLFETHKIHAALRNNTPYYLPPRGLQTRDLTLTSVAKGENVQVLYLTLTERTLEQRTKGKGLLASLLMLPLLLLKKRQSTAPAASVQQLAFVTGTPIDLSASTGMLDKKKRQMREWMNRKSARYRRIYLVSLPAADAEQWRGQIEQMLGQPVIQVDDQFAVQQLWS